MSKFRMIEIDIDIHKRIESERLSFADSPNAVLRRLLDIGPASEPAPGGESPTPPDIGGWSGKGVTLPAATQVRMEYRGERHYGEIRDGGWVVNGQRYTSPSNAAGRVATTKAGTKPSLNGWNYWYVKRPGDDDWIPIFRLRRRR